MDHPKPIVDLMVCARRGMSIILSFALFCLDTAPLHALDVKREGEPSITNLLSRLEIPELIGQVRETYLPPYAQKQDRVIFLVQSAHSNFDAETNTREIIEYLRGTFRVRLVLMEGGEGRFDSLYFRAFPDNAIKEQVIGDYLRQGDLTGGEAAAVFETDPKVGFYGIEDEKLYLEKLQGEKFVPKYYFSGNGFVVREKITGELIGDFLERAQKKEIMGVINKILEITFRMDFLGINKKEMTNPYKHIYVIHKKDDYEVKMIDYERCLFTEKPKNTTQFLQYLKRQSKLLEKKGIVLNDDKIFEISTIYKKKMENNQTKLELIQIRIEDLI